TVTPLLLGYTFQDSQHNNGGKDGNLTNAPELQDCYLWRISMKLSRIALATMLVAAPLAAANAGVTVTPLLLGYTFQDSQHNNGGKDGNLTNAPELQ
ncbi:hypothetical protein, partial [Staphylococcus aureus]|uniref:hypothetical protein n=1 Tax=Staphylococcus aureus TaxID=1280 RepID=UPI001C83D344